MEVLKIIKISNIVIMSKHSSDGIKIAFKHRFNLIGTKFYNNDKIVSLKALRYFKIQTLNNDIFRGMSNLREVWIPPTVTHHAYRTFLDCPNIKTVVIYSETPFTRKDFFNVNTYGYIPSDLKVYVPDSALSRYKEAWKNFPYLSRLHPLSEYQE